MIKAKLESKQIRTLVGTVRQQTQEALAKHTNIDARQCVYYGSCGRLWGMFELLTSVIENTAKTDKAQAFELREIMQEILDQYHRYEAMRKNEAVSFEEAAQRATDQTKEPKSH